MLAARADLRIDGPGVGVHLHGDGPVLVADVRLHRRRIVRALGSVPAAIRAARALARPLRAAGLRVELRIAGRTFARLG